MLEERKKALYASFEASLGENNEFADFLTDILKKEVEYMEKEVGRGAGWRFCSFCFMDLLYIFPCGQVYVSHSIWSPKYTQHPVSSKICRSDLPRFVYRLTVCSVAVILNDNNDEIQFLT